MPTAQPDDGMCTETSGFLFNHRCDRFSVQNCIRCQRPLCEEHGHSTPEGIVCTTCLKQQARADRQSDDDRDTTDRRYYDDPFYHSPYFYGPRYYPGHGQIHSSSRHADGSNLSGSDLSSHDPMDFTEGDAASLRREADADFETDMGAS